MENIYIWVITQLCVIFIGIFLYYKYYKEQKNQEKNVSYLFKK